jgi:hypothetical protein
VLVFPAPGTVVLGANEELVFPAPVRVELGAKEGLVFPAPVTVELGLSTEFYCYWSRKY